MNVDETRQQPDAGQSAPRPGSEKVEASRQHADMLREQVSLLSGQRDEIRQDLERWQQKEEGLQSDVQALGQHVYGLEERIHSLEERKRFLEQHVSELKVQQERLEAPSVGGSLGAHHHHHELGALEIQHEALRADVEWWEHKERELSQHVQGLSQQIQDLESRVKVYEQTRRMLEERLARIREQQSEEASQRQLTEAQNDVNRVMAERDSLRKEVEWWQRKEESLSKSIRELEESLFGMERTAAQWKGVLQQLSEMGFGPGEMSSFLNVLAAAAQRQQISPMELHQRLLQALQNSDDPALTALAGTKREEIARLEEELERWRLEEGRLHTIIDRLRQEQQQIEGSVPGAREAAALEVQRAGEEAAASVREGADLLRRQLDGLLQDAMDIAGRAAQVDADVRSKEWLSKLLALLEGASDVQSVEVRGLGLTLLEAFLTWIDNNSDTTPAIVKEDTERALRAFQAWVG